MTKTFGGAAPGGGRTLYEAALELTAAGLRSEYQKAKLAWENAGKPAIGRRGQLRSVTGRYRLNIGGSQLAAKYEKTHLALLNDVRRKLRSGDLRAVGLELGHIGSEYVEIAPEHWKVLKIKNWQTSIVSRASEEAPTIEVRVYSRAEYQRLLPMRPSEPAVRRRGRTNLGDKIFAAFEATDQAIKAQWKTKADAARHLRNAVDGKGTDLDACRYVQNVLKDELAQMFPNSPDGVTER